MVPDLGIKPLSFWERNVLQPIKTAIKEVEIITTKVARGPTKTMETAWNLAGGVVANVGNAATRVGHNIWSAVQRINPFRADVSPMPLPELTRVRELETELEPKSEQEQEIRHKFEEGASSNPGSNGENGRNNG
jgi:hypothetical protein